MSLKTNGLVDQSARAIALYLQTLYTKAPQNTYIGLSTIKRGDTQLETVFFKITEQSKLIQRILKFEDQYNVFLRVPPLTSRPPFDEINGTFIGRGDASLSAGSAVLWIDIDDYDQTQVVAKLKSLAQPPTLIVNSGHGTHAYWALTQFETDLQLIRAKNKGLVTQLGIKGADSCYDLARILRVPGTYNIKNGLDRPVTILHKSNAEYDIGSFTSAQIAASDVKEYWDSEPLPDNFLETLKAKQKKLYARIFSEATALKNGATSKDDGSLNRSDNDSWIAIKLLSLGYTPGQALTVLSHNDWVSGERYRETLRWDYVTTTVKYAIKQVTAQTPYAVHTGKETQSQIIARALSDLGYTFRLNDCDDTLEVNGEYLSDAIEAKILTQMYDIGFKGAAILRTIMLSLAFDNRYHPIKQYLNQLVWDGIDRIQMLANCLPDVHPPIKYIDGSVKPVCYVYLRRWLVGSVKKVFDGSQNIMLVFVGEQDWGKSSVVAHIGSCLPNYLVTSRIDPNDKDHLLRLGNKFIWDVDELDATTKKADVAAIKSFITMPLADVRRAYGRFNIRKPACVSFIGTVNDNGAGFLMDETGNRRFMVVELSSIDFAYSQIDVHQLWAQAVAYWRAGETGTLETHEKQIQREINAGYEPRDLVEEYLMRYFNIDPNSKAFLTTGDILNHLTDNQVPIRGDERAMQMKIAKTAKRLKLKKYQNGTMRGYQGISPKPSEFRIKVEKRLEI